MPVYMLDTDTASYIMKRSHPNVLKKLKKIPPDDICISAVVLSGLRYGVAISPNSSRNEEALKSFLKYVQVLPYPGKAAEDYGQIRAELKRQGTPIGGNDLLIAAHARCLGMTMVTNNMREFLRVPGLKVENWT
jgi:tRNA(fMet)-specific endonuclease VapC